MDSRSDAGSMGIISQQIHVKKAEMKVATLEDAIQEEFVQRM